eukprot:6443107-Amphidinium_carterae.1
MGPNTNSAPVQLIWMHDGHTHRPIQTTRNSTVTLVTEIRFFTCPLVLPVTTHDSNLSPAGFPLTTPTLIDFADQ